MSEDLDKLSKELRQLADKIAKMKAKEIKMEPGAERKKFKQEIKQKQYQALFYMEKRYRIMKRNANDVFLYYTIISIARSSFNPISGANRPVEHRSVILNYQDARGLLTP